MDAYVGQTILGQFRILEEIGRGGMGSVFKAEQPDMDRLVAVKILHPRLAARPDLVQRFRREARAMSKLTHPNTVRVLLFGQLDSSALYIVMEYLDGKNLLQVERSEGPIDPHRAIRIMISICGALGEAHSNGIVHRDLKPENIVLTTQGGIQDFPKVLDFGLAKMNDPDQGSGSMRALTQAGAVFGTPEFMSPEQAKGEVLDARSDIYSLCVILYEMLTCKLPFKAKNPMDYIAKHVKAEPIPVHERVQGLDLDERHWRVMERALRKSRDDRYQTTLEFAEGLKTLVDGSGSAAGESWIRPSGPEPLSVASLVQAPVQKNPAPTPIVAVQAHPASQQAGKGSDKASDGVVSSVAGYGAVAKPQAEPEAARKGGEAENADKPATAAAGGSVGGSTGGMSPGLMIGIGLGIGILFLGVVGLVVMLL